MCGQSTRYSIHRKSTNLDIISNNIHIHTHLFFTQFVCSHQIIQPLITLETILPHTPIAKGINVYRHWLHRLTIVRVTLFIEDGYSCIVDGQVNVGVDQELCTGITGDGGAFPEALAAE